MENKTKNIYGIEVGMPASFSPFSDMHPAVVTRVTAKTITLCEVAHGPNQVQWPDQDYPVYLDQITGSPRVFRATKRGWQDKYGYRATVGVARHYRDPHF